MRGPDNVDAHPQGASPNGVQDLGSLSHFPYL